MPLPPGARLDVYEIVALIGAGGMGEVYRARDPRLGRDVAIKVLPAAFATDADRLRRFEQEARAAAALNHPNILAVYDIGTHTADGSDAAIPYIVSELLNGESLRERLQHGASGLPLRKVIDYAVQITRGLAAAHERGIIHRDLKPDNIYITDDGGVKLLDFGLAKLIERENPASVSRVDTVPPDTLAGMVIGTVGYMSPEQVRGTATDHRTDIFAFGTVLYEMLSGRRPFGGATAADTMSAVLREDPPDLPTDDRQIPPAIVRLVDRCLQKAPAARFQSAGDLAFALEALSGSASAVRNASAAEAVTTVGQSRSRVAWTLVALLAIVSVVSVGWILVAQPWRAPAPRPITRFTIAPPEGWTFQLASGGGGGTLPTYAPMSMSPDGRRLAFMAGKSTGEIALWVRALDSWTPQMISLGPTVGLFWSPDSRYLAYFTEGKLKRFDFGGGPSATICDSPNGVGGVWSKTGVILIAESAGSGGTGAALQRVAAAGGVPEPATTVPAGEGNHARPVFLPDGKHFIYTAVAVRPHPVYLASLDDVSARVKLMESDSTNVLYSRGHFLFLRQSTLMAQAFDSVARKLVGDVFPIAEDVRTQVIGGNISGLFSAAESGVLAFQTGPSQAANTRLTWLNRKGDVLEQIGERGDYTDLEMSPSGRQAAVSLVDRSGNANQFNLAADIWLFDLARGVRTRLTFDPLFDIAPIWSPDGTRIVFASNRKGAFDLYQRAANGAGGDELLLASNAPKTPMSWSADGQYILYVSTDAVPGTATPPQRTIWALPLTGTREPRRLLSSTAILPSAQLSPDGRWLAYTSIEGGRSEVMVTSFPDGGGRTQVSSGGGFQPRWSRDGRELFFRMATPSSTLMVATTQTAGTTFEATNTRAVFSAAFSPSRYPYDTFDSQRFLVNIFDATPSPAPATPIQVVDDWLAAAGRVPR